jgi:DNA-binding response OmpR family regulator
MLRLHDLEVNLDTRAAWRAAVKLELTMREFDVLLYLLQNRGRTVSREMLAKDVWHETSRFTPIKNVIDVQMARLRRKLDDPFQQKLLRTVRGVGFILGESET